MPQTSSISEPSLWQRTLAYCWYFWGMSICYSANRTLDRSLYVKGVEAFLRATRVWPGFASAYYRAGLIRGRELGEYAPALNNLSQAIALAPEWPEPYLQRGLFLRFSRQYEQALFDLQHYVSLAEEGFWKQEAIHQIAMIGSEQRATEE
jgi:tetratricopeptide (TPR) repeat protein